MLWEDCLHPLAFFFVKSSCSAGVQPVFTALLFTHATWAELIHGHSFTYHITWPSQIYQKLPQSMDLNIKWFIDISTWVPYALKLGMSKIKFTSSPPISVLFRWSLSLVNDCPHTGVKNLRIILGFLICVSTYLLNIPSIPLLFSIFTYSLCEATTTSFWTINSFLTHVLLVLITPIHSPNKLPVFSGWHDSDHVPHVFKILQEAPHSWIQD